jgi:hypothetical protein
MNFVKKKKRTKQREAISCLKNLRAVGDVVMHARSLTEANETCLLCSQRKEQILLEFAG